MATVNKSEALARLIANGNRPDLAAQYVDAYCEYKEAMDNIERNGAICSDPRTGKPIENPFVRIRDAAFRKLRSKALARVKSDGLW